MRITRVGTAILNDSQLTCEPRLDESRGVSPANNWRKSMSDRKTSQDKGPEMGCGQSVWRKARRPSVAVEEWVGVGGVSYYSCAYIPRITFDISSCLNIL